MAHHNSWKEWKEREHSLHEKINYLEHERRKTYSLLRNNTHERKSTNLHFTLKGNKKQLQHLFHLQEEELASRQREMHQVKEKMNILERRQRSYKPIRLFVFFALGISLLLLFASMVQFTTQRLGSADTSNGFFNPPLWSQGVLSLGNETATSVIGVTSVTGAAIGTTQRVTQDLSPAANSYYDPTGDSGSQEWTLNCGACAGSHYLAVDDAVRSPTEPTITDNVSVGSIASPRIENWTVASITESTIATITLYAYVRTGSKNQISLKLTQSGTTQCTISVGTSQAIGWQSCVWSSPTGDLSGITVGAIHTSTDQNFPLTNALIFAAYLDVNYTESGGETPKPQDTNMSCGTLNWNTTLNVTSVTNTSTCYTVNASNIDLNCAGAAVTYGTGGFGSGVDNTAGYNGVTIRNCNFAEGGSTGSSKYGIYFTGGSSGTIRNNTISTFSTSSTGIRFDSSSNSNLVVSNAINTSGSSANGIHLLSASSNTFDNNNISTNGSGAHGINFAQISLGNILVNNNITTALGLLIQDTTGNTYANNLIYNNSLGEIRWNNATNGSYLKNLTTNGTSALGIGLGRNIFIGNNTAAVNTSNFNVGVINSSANISFFKTGISTIDQLLRAESFTTARSTILIEGSNCTGVSCFFISNSSETLAFNTSFFSSFTGNTLPPAPRLLLPANASTSTNRTLGFTWNVSTDDNGDIPSYNLVIDDSATFNNPEINVTGITNTTPENVTYDITTELAVDTTYYWRVRANDSGGYSGESTMFNFTLQSLLSMTVLNNTVAFGTVSPGANLTTSNRTTAGNASPFLIENNGNIIANITVTATPFFMVPSYPSFNYQFRAEVNKTGSFNTSISNTSFINMNTSSAVPHVLNLDWHTQQNDVVIGLNVSVPNDEPAGTKNSEVTFTVASG